MDRPDPERLTQLSADAWRTVVAHLRRVLDDVDDVPAVLARLRSAPAQRLLRPSIRRRVAAALSEGTAVWQTLTARLEQTPEGRAVLEELAAPASPPDAGPATRSDSPGGEQDGRLRVRLRERAEQLAVLRRQLDGAEARARRAEQRIAELETDRERLEQRIAELTDALERARAETEAAVERERRRAASAQAELSATLRAVRRELAAEQQRRRQLEAELARRPARPEPRPARAAAAPAPADDDVDGLDPRSAEYAARLLRPGVRLLVDGYNLTRSRFTDTPLADQRAWAVRLLEAVAVRFGVHPEVVFDASEEVTAGGPFSRLVRVRFAGEGSTADDDIVFEVEATDVPTVVVTDDRELAARARRAGARVVGTVPFLAAVQ